VADDIHAETTGSEYRDEDEQAPTGSEAIFANEYLVKS